MKNGLRTEVTELRTEAVYSESGERRFLLRKTWDESKPKLAILLLAPSVADGIQLDMTTQLVVNNSARLGYGSVAILNLSAVLNDYLLKHTEDDPENLKVILEEAANVEKIIYAAGTGKQRNRSFILLQKRVLLALKDYEPKLYCLCNEDGEGRLQHPLSPQVRTWSLSPLKISELIAIPTEAEQKPKKKPKAKEPKDDPAD